jgi:hypothetical protein
MRFWQLGLLATGLMVSAAAPARANISFSLAPMTAELEVKAGEQHTGTLLVSHDVPDGAKADSLPPLLLRLYAADWTLDRKGSPTFSKPNSFPGSCSSWVQINPVSLSVKAGEKAEVRYTITVPPGMQGTFRTVLMFESAPQPRTDGDRVVSVNGRIGATVYVHVGPQSKRAKIQKLAVTPESSVVTVENTGTSHVRLKGVLQFRDEAGKMVSEVQLPGGVVLPGESNLRDVTVPTPKLPASGTYTVTAVIDYGGEVLIGARSKVTIP